MRRVPRLGIVALVGLAGVAILPPPLSAQRVSGEFSIAFAAERQGRWADAADEYGRILDATPTNLQALFGLERVLRRLELIGDLLPRLDAALERSPGSSTVWGLKLRTLGQVDSLVGLEATAEAWIERHPTETDSYREWAFVLASRGQLREARRILERGHARIGGEALLAELAQVAVVSGDWIDAARRWHQAATTNPEMLAAGGVGLAQAPLSARDAVVNLLLRDLGDSTARLLTADVLIGWGRADEAWTMLDGAMPEDPVRAVAILQRFADRARLVSLAPSARARGRALERVAELSRGPAAQQARADAARAYADGGDREGAARMLALIAADTTAAPATAGGAMVAMIGVAADAGRVEEAQERFEAWGDRLPIDEREELRARIVWGWLRRGDVDRAALMVPADSSLETAALTGWVALYAGRIGAAVEAFRRAGPFTGERSDATARTEILALLQRIEADSLLGLGEALLPLVAGDTAQAVARMTAVAGELPVTGGGADLLAFAGRLAAHRDPDVATALLRRALALEPDGPRTPSALFTLAEIDARAGRLAEAAERLEVLILSHPESAVVPQARRLLDQVRGRIPTS